MFMTERSAHRGEMWKHAVVGRVSFLPQSDGDAGSMPAGEREDGKQTSNLSNRKGFANV